MPNGGDTIQFDLAFGLGPFKAQSRQIRREFSGIKKDMTQSAAPAANLVNSFSGMRQGLGAAAAGAAKFAAPMLSLLAVGGIFRSMNQMMPFLGQGFSQMGMVIRNNLLWPLTQELLPLMIRLMNWVRDNRTEFIKLGAVLVNVFRAFFGMAKGIFKALKGAFDVFFKSVFGGSMKGVESFSRFVNFILIKTALIFNFVLMLIEPVFKVIGKLAANLWNNILSPFLDGFSQGFDDIIEPMESIISLIKRMASDISGLIGGDSSEAFMILGRIIGDVVLKSLERIIGIAETLWDIFSGFFKAVTKGFKKALGKKGLAGFEKNLDVILDISEILFWKVFIPFLKLAIPLAAKLGSVIGTSIGSAIMVVVGAIKALVRVFRFFTDDLPKAFKALPNLLLRAWKTITAKLRSLFVSIIRPFLKMVILIDETASKLGILKTQVFGLKMLRQKLEKTFPELKQKERRKGAMAAPALGPSLAMAPSGTETNNTFTINVSGPGAAEQANRFVEIRTGRAEEVMRRRARRGLVGSSALG